MLVVHDLGNLVLLQITCLRTSLVGRDRYPVSRAYSDACSRFPLLVSLPSQYAVL